MNNDPELERSYYPTAGKPCDHKRGVNLTPNGPRCVDCGRAVRAIGGPTSG